MSSIQQQIAHRDFSFKTIRALEKKQITIMSTQLIPGNGPMPMANASRGYVVNDSGCCRVLTFNQILSLAE